MKKLKKIMAGLLSAVTAFSAMTAFSVNAEETTEEKLYTLEELFAMSEEEFLALDDRAFECFESIKNDAEFAVEVYDSGFFEYGGISGVIRISVGDQHVQKKYVANETEIKIIELLGDTIEYEMKSPIALGKENIDAEDLYYRDEIRLFFADLEQYSRSDWFPPYEDIIKMAKCYYCVDQVLDIRYMSTYVDTGSMGRGDKILIGDANLDHVVDLYDVIHITKHVAMNFEFTALQKAITDVNNDGIVNSVDAVFVGMQIMENVT